MDLIQILFIYDNTSEVVYKKCRLGNLLWLHTAREDCTWLHTTLEIRDHTT